MLYIFAVHFDWQSIEDRLFEKSQACIVRFAQEHPDVSCSFFAYDTDPTYGYFYLSFDTPEHALEEAQEYERLIRSHRYSTLSDEEMWRYAEMVLKNSTLITYGPDAGGFAYPEYDRIIFNELDALSVISPEEDPELAPLIREGYLNGNVYRMLWKLSERLVASGVFKHLRLASPFRIGLQFHEDRIVVLRILNWPAASTR